MLMCATGFHCADEKIIHSLFFFVFLVVYEHRTKLEAALLKERKDHRKTKHGM